MAPELSPRSRRALGLLLLVALVATAGCSYTPPPSICAVCDEQFVNAASTQGVDVSIDHSELHLHLRADGSARWEARVRLNGSGVDDLRSDDSLRNTVVERRLRNDSGPAPGDHPNLTTSMTDDTLVVRFDEPALATRHAGDLLVVERFHHQQAATEPSPFWLRADRMVLHPPDGWVVVNEPPRTSGVPDAVVWTDDVDSRTYVVVGPDRSRKTIAAGQVAVGVEVASWAVGPWLAASVLPVLGFGVVLLVLLQRVDHEPAREYDLPVDPELVGGLTVAAVVWLVAAVAAVAFQGRFVNGWGSLIVVGVGPGAVLCLVTGAVAHRRPAVRWSTAVLAVGVGPLTGLWIVLGVGKGSTSISSVVMLVWMLVMVVVGSVSFTIGKEAASVSSRTSSTREPPRR